MIIIQTTKFQPTKTIKAYIVLTRPKHWLKNALIFVPIVYAHNLFEIDLLLSTMWTFVAFCLVSSAVYVINDIKDVEKDRQHPSKSSRPIASGQVAMKQAKIFAVFLFIIGFILSIVADSNYFVLLFVALYALLNFAYTFKLKHYAIVDCFCIAAGFVLRIYAGGAASGDRITEWLFLTMVAVSLFMAFGKRRGEMIHISDTCATRKVLSNYNLNFLNGMLFACAGLSIVFYSLWAMMNVSTMIYTVPIVVFIICKYLLILHDETSHGDPTSIIWGDKVLLSAIGVFGLLSVALLYL